MADIDSNHTIAATHPAADTDDLTSLYAADEHPELADSPRDVGARLTEAREASCMSLDDLARRIGVRTATVERWEAGALSPGSHHLSKLAGILGVSLSWLIVGRGDHPVSSSPAVDGDELVQLVASVRDQIGDAMSTLERVEQQIANGD